jgi:hypothetical protein
MSSEQVSTRIEQLLAAYQQEHPFLASPEHTGERGLHTARYYDDVFAHNQVFCLWVQEQALQESVTIHRFQLSQGRRTQDTYLYDLLVDGVIVLHDAHFQESYEYALQQMNNEDLYCEAAMEVPFTARDLRKSHNAMEADFASDGSYTPKYSYQRGPFTSEPREEW